MAKGGKRLAKVVLLGILVASAPQGQGAMANDAELIQSAFARLDRAMDWLVTQGTVEYAALGRAAFDTKLIRDFKVNLWVTPTGEGLPDFRIKSRGINYDIKVVQQREVGGRVFEQWVVQISARDWAGAGPGCRFFLTQLGPGKARKILRSGDQYRDVFLSGNVPVRFDDVDLAAAYRLGAWYAPGCYDGTDLAAQEVYYNDAGQLAARPAQQR